MIVIKEEIVIAKEIKETVLGVLVLVYDFCLVAGTVYLVEFHNWSMWTFFLTLCFMFSFKTKHDKSEA